MQWHFEVLYNVNKLTKFLQWFYSNDAVRGKVRWKAAILKVKGIFPAFRPTECCWRAGTIQLTIQYLFQGKNSKKFHQISDFKVILLWTTMHEIQKIGGGGSCPLAGSNLGILFLGVAKPVHYHYATQLHISYV